MAGPRWCTLTLALAPALAGCTADDSFADDGGYVVPTDATLYEAPSLPMPDVQSEEAAPGDGSLDADSTVDADGAVEADASADADGALADTAVENE
jgi:hypothetical protein